MARFIRTTLAAAAVCASMAASAQVETFEADKLESIKKELGVKFLVSPLEQTEGDDYLKKPFRPMVVETKGLKGDNLYQYVYDYDKEGKDLGGTGPCMVRSHKLWNAEAGTYYNDTRFKAVFDGRGDMATYYMDMGNKDTWNNYYRFNATYNDNHQELECSQNYWNGTGFEPRLRWTNTYDEKSRIVEQQYESSYDNSGKFSKGLLVKWGYDDADNETYYEQLSWKDDELHSLIRRDQTYDGEGNVLTQTFGSQGVNTGRFTYTYDEDGNRTSTLQESWDKSKSRFYATIYTTFTFENGKEVSELKQISEEKLPANETNWKVYKKAEFQYLPNDGGYNVTTSEYDEKTDTWTYLSREIRIFNANGDLTRQASDTFDIDKNQFATTMQQMLTYDGNNNLTSYKYQMRNPNGTSADDWWTDITSYTFEYDENDNCTKITTLAKGTKDYIYMPYNNMANQWECPEADSFTATCSDYLDLHDYVEPTAVALDKATLSLDEGKSESLAATILPENATNKQVHWQSQNPDVAIVSVDGMVTALKEGTAVITATTLEGLFTASCQVSVKGTTGIDGTSMAGKEKARTERFAADGTRLDGPAARHGFVIERTVYTDGTVGTGKVLK